MKNSDSVPYSPPPEFSDLDAEAISNRVRVLLRNSDELKVIQEVRDKIERSVPWCEYYLS